MTPWEVLVLHPFFVLFRFHFLILAFFLVVFFLHPWVTHSDRHVFYYVCDLRQELRGCDTCRGRIGRLAGDD